MKTGWRDNERTFADFYWQDDEQQPRKGTQGLQINASRGFEYNRMSGDIIEYIYGAGGWRILTKPDGDRRDIATLQAQIATLDARVTVLENARP